MRAFSCPLIRSTASSSSRRSSITNPSLRFTSASSAVRRQTSASTRRDRPAMSRSAPANASDTPVPTAATIFGDRDLAAAQ